MTLTQDLISRDVLKRLTGLYSSGRLAHAYLFSGPNGIGKFETAMALAQALNCHEPGGFTLGCHCASCRKIIDGNHPDLFIIEKPEDKTEIVIGQITPKPSEPYRPLLPWLSVRALEADVRVVIIKDAELLNHSAANAFLKTLEEPCPGTLLILTSAASGNIPVTVISRCHEVRFFPVGPSLLAGRLKNEYDLTDPGSMVLARFSGGSPGRAAEFGKEFITRKNTIIDEFILSASNEAALKIWSSGKEDARDLLGVVLAFYRDVACVQSGAESGCLYNNDRAADIQRVAARTTPEEVQAVIDQAVMTFEAVDENFNVKTALTLLKELI